MRVQFPEKLEFLFTPARYKVAHGGRGSGKSWGVARALLIMAATKPLRILCTREVQKSIKDSVHRLLSDQIPVLGLGAEYEVLDTEIRGRNGSLFVFAGLSSHTVESIKSYEGVDIVWVEEAQSVSKRSWDVLTPTIRKPGSEIWLTLNPDLDTDETYVRFISNPPSDARVVQVNWRDNPWFGAELEAERKATLKRAPDDYDNIWEGMPKRTVDGAIYKHEIDRLYAQGRIRAVPYDPLLKVHTVWDLGFNDSMAIILVQRYASELRIIEYIEDSHKRLDEYVREIEKRKYRWGQDYLPHDGRAKDYRSGRSAEEIVQTMGRSPRIVPNIGVEQGIKTVRMVFDRCYFDKDNASKLVERLKRYRRAIPTSTNEPAHPLHDENSHGSDAFRYLAVVADQLSNADDFPVDQMEPEVYAD